LVTEELYSATETAWLTTMLANSSHSCLFLAIRTKKTTLLTIPNNKFNKKAIQY